MLPAEIKRYDQSFNPRIESCFKWSLRQYSLRQVEKNGRISMIPRIARIEVGHMQFCP